MSSSSSSTTTDKLNFLYEKGKLLSELLRNAKTKDKKVIKIPNKLKQVDDIITDVLKKLNETLSESIEESLATLVKRIGSILEDFIHHDDPDHKSGYEVLARKVGEFEYQRQASSPAPDSVKPSASASPADSTKADSSPKITDSEKFDFTSVAVMLSPNELEYLYCISLFPDDTEIKKREIIHCWIGMDLNLEAPIVWERLLAKFVALGLIERISQSKKQMNRYKMSKGVRSSLPNQQTIQSSKTVDNGSWSMLYKQQAPVSQTENTLTKSMTLLRRGSLLTPSADDKGEPEALLNVSQTKLNAARFKNMSGKKNLKVVHLGSWQQDPTRATTYIVVEDSDALKELKSLSNVRFLSLEGVSGMVNLPLSVYELKLLKVLDLRACNNLEHLPKGFDSLVNLTHLDLSGCYLLDHVPEGIIHLEHLRVLKGFIINDVDQPQNEEKSKNKGKEKREGNGKRKGKGKTTRTTSIPCPFDKLSHLGKLRKLTILTRRKNFPTQKDFETFSRLQELSSLRVTWVGDSSPDDDNVAVEGTLFPPTLTKLELQAASHRTASLLLRLISEDTSRCGLQKLSLRGGGLAEFKYLLPQPTAVRLRYLPDLQIDWDDFRKLFPNVDRLEVLKCPNLILFPCDKNGVWERTQSILDDKEYMVINEDDEKKEIRNHEDYDWQAISDNLFDQLVFGKLGY